MYPVLTIGDLIRDSCPYKGCRFNGDGYCSSETSLVKKSAIECDYDVKFECRHYGLKAIDICFKCGGVLNLNPAHDMYGEIDKTCPKCIYATRLV